MKTPDVKEVQFRLQEGESPLPVFANHITIVGINQFVIVSFYAGLPEDTKQLEKGEIAAKLVARMVVPEERWLNLIENVMKSHEPKAEAEGDHPC